MKKKLTAIAIIACLVVVSLSTIMFSQTRTTGITINTPSGKPQHDTLTQPPNSSEPENSDNHSYKDSLNGDEQTPENRCSNCSSEAAQDSTPETNIPPPDGRIFLTAGPPYPYIPTVIPIKIKDPILPLDPIG